MEFCFQRKKTKQVPTNWQSYKLHATPDLPTLGYSLHFKWKGSAKLHLGGKQRHSSSDQRIVPSRWIGMCHSANTTKCLDRCEWSRGASTLAPSCLLANSCQQSPASQCKSDTNLSGLCFRLRQVFACMAISIGGLFYNTWDQNEVSLQKTCSMIKIHLTNSYLRPAKNTAMRTIGLAKTACASRFISLNARICFWLYIRVNIIYIPYIKALLIKFYNWCIINSEFAIRSQSLFSIRTECISSNLVAAIKKIQVLLGPTINHWDQVRNGSYSC